MDLPPSTAWGTRTQTITIQGSTDGSTYTTLAASAGYTFNPSTGNTVTVTFPAAQRPLRQADLHRQHRLARRAAVGAAGLLQLRIQNQRSNS